MKWSAKHTTASNPMTLAFNKPESKRTRQHLRANMPSAEIILWEVIACAAREQIELHRPLDAPGRRVRRAKKSVDATPPCEGGEKL